MFICPKCKKPLTKQNNSYKCINNHNYDISKFGYVNLLLSKPNAGDNKEMVEARFDFLKKNYYLNLANTIAKLINKYFKEKLTILEAGCGTGYYVDILSSLYPIIYGFDISKLAIEKASKHNKAIHFFVASSNDIPLENCSVDLILNIFSPTFEKEFYRLLSNEGYMFLVTPGKDHLFELKTLLYDNPYQNDELLPILNCFTHIENINIKYKISITNNDLINLVKMTPYYYKTKKDSIEDLYNISNIDLTIDFDINVFKKL